MRENEEQLSSIAHAQGDGKPAPASNNWGHSFDFAVNGYAKSTKTLSPAADGQTNLVLYACLL